MGEFNYFPTGLPQSLNLSVIVDTVFYVLATAIIETLAEDPDMPIPSQVPPYID